MFRALIPAAGHSTRMGQPKLALPLGSRTVLERVIDALKAAGAEVLVVLGPHVVELGPAARTAGAEVLQLPEATPDMRTTVEGGLNHLEARYRPAPDEPWLLVPADHPALDAGLVRRLFDELWERPECSIAVPMFGGKRGHPTLIRWKHVAGIRAFPKDRGLNAYLRGFLAETLELPVDMPDVLLDLDTPEDYARMATRFGRITPDP